MGFYRERAIIAKVEDVEGTDSTPDGDANAILVGNMTTTPINGSVAERDLVFPDFGSLPASHVNKHVMLGFRVEIAGAGVAGAAPLYGPLLRASSFSETITDTVKVEYDLVSIGQESCSIYSFEGSTLHKLVGAKSQKLSFVFGKDDHPYMEFTMLGRWTIPAAGELPACDFSGWPKPLPMGKINTPTFTVDAYTAVLESKQIDIDYKAVHRDRPNAAYVAQVDAVITGQQVFEAPDIGTKDFFAKAYGDGTMVRQLIHGVGAGKIFQIDEPKLQIIQPTYVDLDGIRGLSMQTRSNRNAGNDALKITVK